MLLCLLLGELPLGLCRLCLLSGRFLICLFDLVNYIGFDRLEQLTGSLCYDFEEFCLLEVHVRHSDCPHAHHYHNIANVHFLENP